MNTVLPLNTWKRFVSEGALDSSRLCKRISESWYRSKNAQVSPFLSEATHILSKAQFEKQKEKHSLLFNIANLHLKRMNDSINSLGMIALIIDPEGYVLSISGSKEVVHKAKKINFVEGVRWTEGEVGTNAIGTALQIQEPVMISGSEHYSIASHNWSCSASPIRNDDGKLLGIIDVSCPVERAHPYMLGMVTSVAYAIERDLRIRVHKDEMELIQKSIELIDIEQPVVICNNKNELFCASKPIRQSFPQIVGKDLTELTQCGFTIQMEVPIYSTINRGYIIGRAVYLVDGTMNKSNQIFIPSLESKRFHFKGEVGTSQSFQRTLEEVKCVAKSDASVYILGETGTGKEVIAQSIHENSLRRSGPFVAINCGAIPKELIVSELFGYVDGAFTGARRQGNKGKFEQANEGTIFLDEIGEIPESMQVALLRVLQERKVTPIGGTKEIPLDIRIITATHRDLRQLVNEGKFREDLYYRLHVYPISVPSLRERKEDIPHLVRYFCQKNNWNIEFPSEVLTRLMNYHWPGNIRELLNVIERIHIISQGKAIDTAQLLNWLQSFNSNDSKTSAYNEKRSDSVKVIESCNNELTIREKIQKDLMIDALQKTKGNVTLAAELLEIPRSTFYKRIRKFNL